LGKLTKILSGERQASHRSSSVVHGAVAKAVADPDVRQRLEVPGYVPLMSSAEEATARFESDGAKWAKVIRTPA
jgi:tripartite-type tricarboxylate transporter receptor subunit TctC